MSKKLTRKEKDERDLKLRGRKSFNGVTIPKRFRAFCPAPKDYSILVVALNVWGRGKTIEAALKGLIKAGYGSWLARGAFLVYYVDPSAHVDNRGDICYNKSGKKPHLVAELPAAGS